MPKRLGRLQRQSRRAFWASAAPEVSTSQLAGWLLGETDANGKARTLTLATGIDDPSCAVGRPSPLHWAAAAPGSKGRSPDSRLMVDWLTP